MTEEDMKDLIIANDAVEDLLTLTTALTGKNEAYSYADGIVGALARISDVIMRNSTLAKQDEDAFFEVLLDKNTTPIERARRLL